MAAEKKISLAVKTLNGEDAGKVEVSADVFGVTDVNPQVIKDAVTVYRANLRQATAKTKKRHEVHGTNKKPWRQKGTGRARSGDVKSPIWVGGGKVFGPDGNQNYKISQNKKAHALALKTVLSQKVNGGIIVVDSLKAEKISTKAIKADLANVKASGKILLVSQDENVIKSAQNIDRLELRAVNNISVYDVLNANVIVIGKADIETLEGGLK